MSGFPDFDCTASGGLQGLALLGTTELRTYRDDGVCELARVVVDIEERCKNLSAILSIRLLAGVFGTFRGTGEIHNTFWCLVEKRLILVHKVLRQLDARLTVCDVLFLTGKRLQGPTIHVHEDHQTTNIPSRWEPSIGIGSKVNELLETSVSRRPDWINTLAAVVDSLRIRTAGFVDTGDEGPIATGILRHCLANAPRLSNAGLDVVATGNLHTMSAHPAFLTIGPPLTYTVRQSLQLDVLVQLYFPRNSLVI